MLKLLKILLVLAVFVVLALLTAPLFIDINNYKSEINKAAYEATGRDIQIEHIELSMFPWVGLSLQNVHLQNALGFAHPHMLNAKSIDIQLELIPLLNKQIKVKRFTLDTPKIWLEQRADGLNNWDDLQHMITSTGISGLSAAQESSKKTLLSQVGLSAELLQIQRGQIVWSDAATGSLKMSDIELEIQDLQLKQPISLDLSAKINENAFQVHANIGPIEELKDLDVTKLPILLRIQSERLSLEPFAAWFPNQEQESQFDFLKQAKVSLDISLEQHHDQLILSTGSLQLHNKHLVSTSWQVSSNKRTSFKIQDFQLHVDNTQVFTLTGSIKGINHNPYFEIRMETGKLQRIWLNQFSPNLQALYQNHPQPWQTIKLGTLVAGDLDILNIRDLQLHLDGEPVQASGNIALGAVPDVQLRILANTLHVDPWIPQYTNTATQPSSSDLYTFETAPQAVINNSPPHTEQTSMQEPNLTFLKPWYLSLQFKAKAIYAQGLELNRPRLTLSAEKGVIRLNPLSFEMNEGQVLEKFTLYANQYPARWKGSIKVSDIDVYPLLKTFAGLEQLSGNLQLNTELSGQGLLPSNMLKSLNGQGNFVLEDGYVAGIDIVQEMRQAEQEASQLQNNTDFTQMQGSFRIKKGVLSNNDLYMASPLFRLTGKGKLYLDPLKVDYNVRPKLVNSLAKLQQNRAQAGAVIPLRIYGPIDQLNTTIETDLKSRLKRNTRIKKTGREINTTVDQVLKEDNQQHKKGAQEQLKKAFQGLKF